MVANFIAMVLLTIIFVMFPCGSLMNFNMNLKITNNPKINLKNHCSIFMGGMTMVLDARIRGMAM